MIRSPEGSGYAVGVEFVREGRRIVAFEVTDVAPSEVVRRLRFDRIR